MLDWMLQKRKYDRVGNEDGVNPASILKIYQAGNLVALGRISY